MRRIVIVSLVILGLASAAFVALAVVGDGGDGARDVG
jgi:hypothetical protein